MLLFAHFAAALVRLTVVPSEPAVFWEASLPHTIIVFPRPIPSTVVVEIMSSAGKMVQSLSRVESVIAINFGSDTGLKLRFRCSWEAQHIAVVEFAVFEPATVPDHYVVSTAARENFALSSPGLCAHPDFGIAPPLSYGFFYLNDAPSRIKNKQFNLHRDDRIRYAVYDVPKPVLVELPAHEEVDKETQAFTEWFVRIDRATANRTLVLLARPTGENETQPSLPEFRAVFTSGSGLAVIRGARGVNRRFLSDDPCAFETGRRRHGEARPESLPPVVVELLKRTKTAEGEEGVTRTEAISEGLSVGQEVVIALFLAGAVAVIAVAARVVFRARGPRLRDMDGLLVGDGGARAGLIPGLDTGEAPARGQ